jgi:hypothetical protein
MESLIPPAIYTALVTMICHFELPIRGARRSIRNSMVTSRSSRNIFRATLLLLIPWTVGPIDCALTGRNCQPWKGSFDVTKPGLNQFTFDFTYGKPFTFEESLDTGGSVTATSNFGPFGGTMTADYLGPTHISQIAMTDANGNPVTDWTITSGSGLDYSGRYTGTYT